MVVVITLTAAPLVGIDLNMTTKALIVAISDCKVGDIIEFGSYPQSKVTDLELLNSLNSQSLDWVSYEYFSGTGVQSNAKMQPGDWMKYADITYDGKKYRAVKFTQYRPYSTVYVNSADKSWIDDYGYCANTVYWFEYEPIEWYVLDPEEGFVLCKSVIDAQPYSNGFYYSAYNSYNYFNSISCKNYANDYETSSVRAWLNDEFYNIAFSSNEKANIETSMIDSSYYWYDSKITYDKVFLLSFNEVNNNEYGFNSTTKLASASGTAYALCQGAHFSRNSCFYWWLRTSKGNNSYAAYYVDCEGDASDYDQYSLGVSRGFGIRPALRLSNDYTINKKAYCEKYGWSLTNGAHSYGYPDRYRIPYKRYFELYGINAKSLIESFVNISATSFTKKLDWNGNCFGLSLLSLAQYYNLIDLSGLFNKSGDTLYDFGYEKIDTDSSGKQCYSLEGNDDAIAAVERALLAQDSAEFKKCEVFSMDSDFSGIIEHLSSDDGEPIMVNFMGSNGSGHTMVLTNDIKPKLMSDGYYYISTYDPNAPVNNGVLTNPTKEYNYGVSILMVNPETSKWKYYANGEVQFGNSYYVPGLDIKSIWFYDVSQLDSSFFTKKLSLWIYDVKLDVSASNLTIKNKYNENIFKVKNGSVEFIADGYDFKYRYNSTDNSAGTGITFYANDDEEFIIVSDAAEIMGMNDEYIFLLSMNSESETVVNFEEGSAIVTNLKTSSEDTHIVAQNISKDYAVKVSDKTLTENTLTLTVGGNKPTVSSNVSDDMLIEAEGVDKSNVEISVTNPCIDGHQMQLIKQVKPTCNTEGTDEYYFCVKCEKKFEDINGETVADNLSIPATGHTAGSWVTTKHPSCTEEGTKEQRCKTCNSLIATQIIAKTEHVAGNWQIVTMPSATNEGLKVQKCAGCGKEMARETMPMIDVAIAILSPSTTTVSYGDTLVLHSNLFELPVGVNVVWTVEGTGVNIRQSEDGLTCEVTSIQKGDVIVKATIVDENGVAVLDENGNEIFAAQQWKSNVNLWQRIVSFFKNLFRISRIILQAN